MTTMTRRTRSEVLAERAARAASEDAHDPLGLFSAPPPAEPADADPTPVWFRNMNPEQAETIAHQDGPLLVDAGAGSGKTRALVHRICRLVKEGVSPNRIMAVTFSAKAAAEMNTRLRKLGIHADAVGTWHSFCLRVLREDNTRWAPGEANGVIVDDKDKARYVLKEVLGYKYLDWKDADFGEVRRYIGWCKAHLWLSDSIEAMEYAMELTGGRSGKATKFVDAYAVFQKMIEERGLLTFDDYLVNVWKHFLDENNRASWAAKFDYVLQDEYQDANRAQKVIAQMLAQDHRNYMVVGDVAQSIYGFRGSKPEFIAGFAEEWNAKIIHMRRNYRSGRAIVALANAVIEDGQFRGPDMLAEVDFDGSVKASKHEDFDDEAQGFAQWVVEHKENGGRWSDSTCLFRTTAQSRALEEALLSARVPYVVVGGASFYERKEVKDLLAYLRVAADMDTDGDAVKRSINTPFRYLGARFVERVEAEARTARPTTGSEWSSTVMGVAAGEGIQARQRASASEWCGLIGYLHGRLYPTDSTMKPAKPAELLNDVIHRTRYIDYLTKEEGEESIESSHAANVRELVRVAERFPTVQELLTYIAENIAASKRQRSDGKKGDVVLLMTIHKSKGLEWPRLWVVGCNDGILPFFRGEPEEEKRLAYVAVTRAQNELVCSYVNRAATRAGVREMPPAEWLVRAGLVEATKW